jgi:hypothetical protein
MHTPTEDLLSRRDERTREALRALPELSPPSQAWSDIRVAARTAALTRSARRRRRAIGLAAAFVSAAVVLSWQWSARRGPDTEPVQAVVSGAAPPAVAAAQSAPVPDYGELLAESARLERLLLALPRGGQVMKASTAGTIVGLEDQVAYIDERLTFAAASGSQREYRQALWRERVDVMNALVQVRYAQVNSAGY